ncbi:MAG: hypothetical protein KDJ78_07680 [Rhodobacteraceae bacterium]|nr:hypothetical protein [Paracoccaceae bacterium]MCB1374036.1 hypothetical protein [Paracoccaceae bacterium]
MTDSLTSLLLRQSEVAERPILWGGQAAPRFGRQFDRLIERGALVELAPATEWSVCASCECGMDARIVREINGQLRALCLLDPACDAILEPDDLRAFRIDPERLVGLIAEASGFAGPIEPLAPDLWRLGRLASGRSVVVGFAARAIYQPGIVLLLKAAANGAAVTVVAPDPGPAIRLRFIEAGIDLVELRSTLLPTVGTVDRLDPAMLEPRIVGPRLVIERRARRASLDGRSIHLSDQLFALLLFLAQRALDGPETVDFRVIEDHVWGAGIHRISSGIREPVRALRDALAADAKDRRAARALIENTRNPNGYRLNLPAAEIAIAD